MLVGSQQAGLHYHLQRIRETAPDVFMPIRTYTTFDLISREMAPWYALMIESVFSELQTASLYTDKPYPLAKRHEYLVTYGSFSDVMTQDRIGLIGMSSRGYTRLMAARPLKIPCPVCRGAYDVHFWDSLIQNHRVISLKPDERAGFVESLMSDYDLTVEQAVECTEQLKFDSTIPSSPPDDRVSGIYELAISGPRDKDFIEKLKLTLSEAS